MPCDNLMFRATSLSIFCTDADRSDRFYREVLGAIREPRDGYGCKWYRLGTVSFSLVPNASAASPAKFPNDAMPALRLEVDDVRAVHAHLVKHGVTIIQPPEDRTQMIIADPDGLPIEVWQADPAAG